MGSWGLVIPCCETKAGLTTGVVEAGAVMGMGMMVFEMRNPSSLMAAMKAGTRTAWGDCEMGRAHCMLSGTLLNLSREFDGLYLWQVKIGELLY